MKLVVTIDTEEDSWNGFTDRSYTAKNIQMIPTLQNIFDKFNIKPTYLVTYEIANDVKSVEILKKISDDNKCEIGAHCHPWNTPPFEEEINEKNSLLCNLPKELQYKKLQNLNKNLKNAFGKEPISFRAGRWGYNHIVAENLHRLGYQIDTSVCSYKRWSRYNSRDNIKISPKQYRFSLDNIYSENVNGPLLEVPATIAFLQNNFKVVNFIYNILSTWPISKINLVAAFEKIGIINKVWLCPEMNGSTQMVRLTKHLKRKGYEIANLFFHSSTLQVGLTPFVKNIEDQKKFFNKIQDYAAFIAEENIEPVMLSDCIKK